MAGPKWPIKRFARWDIAQGVYFEDADGNVWYQTPTGHPVRQKGTRSEVEQQILEGKLRGTLTDTRNRNPKRRARKKVRKSALQRSQEQLAAARLRELTWHAPKRQNPKRRAKTRVTVRYKITAQNKGKRMHYDGRNFSQRPTVKSFALAEDAKQTALALIRRYPILRKYRVRVESFP